MHVPEGARVDFEKVIDLAPESKSANTARNEINKLSEQIFMLPFSLASRLPVASKTRKPAELIKFNSSKLMRI